MSELHRFTAGDLSQQAAAKVQSHLRDCSACATQLYSWDQTLEAYRRHVPGAREPLPRWDGFDEALRHEEKAWRGTRTARTRRWAAAAAITVTVLGSAWFWQRTEVVLNAEEVITRAVRQEQENLSSNASAVWIREAGGIAAGGEGAPGLKNVDSAKDSASEAMSSRGRVARELAARLAAYGFTWAAPLSAQPLQRWRTFAERPHDSIQLIEPALLKVSTTTSAGTIRHAEIVVRQHTYQPVSQHWRFADGFEVELTSVKPDEPVPATSPVVVAAAPETVKPEAPSIDMEAVELDLRSTLQRLGSPVGSALTIRHVRGGLRVEGTVSTNETAGQVAAFARGRPFVDARVVVGLVATERDVAISPEMHAWLDRALRNDDARQTFAGRTWELCDQLHLNIAALQELARRYSDGQTATLSPDAQRKLADLAARQYGAVTTDYEALERQLAPLIGTISRPLMPAVLPAEWRRVGAAANHAINQLTASLWPMFDAAGAIGTPETLERRARDAVRPALEALAAAIAGEP